MLWRMGPALPVMSPGRMEFIEGVEEAKGDKLTK